MFFLNAPPTTEIYTLSLHDALPISGRKSMPRSRNLGRMTRRAWVTSIAFIALSAVALPTPPALAQASGPVRSEEHTSELQSRPHLVCRLLLEKKKKNTTTYSAESHI